jgi:transposase
MDEPKPREPTCFVGLDVHADTIAVAVLPRTGVDAHVEEIANEPEAIHAAIVRLRRGRRRIACCYEAGPCGFGLQRQLEAMRVACSVAAPSKMPRPPGDRVKTDERDAIRLARMLRAGELPTIRIPNRDEEAVRDLVRARDDMRGTVVGARNRLSQFLLRHGLRYRDGCAWTGMFWHWARRLHFDRPVEKATFEHYVSAVEHALDRRAELERAIERIATTEPYRAAVARLSCLNGIGTLSAMTLVAEIADFRRFRSARELMAFVGLVPREQSSGALRRRYGITRSGNAGARRVLIEASRVSRKSAVVTERCRALLAAQPAEVGRLVRRARTRLRERYLHLTAHGKKKAVVVTAMARELCGFVWALMTRVETPRPVAAPSRSVTSLRSLRMELESAVA